MIINLKAKEGDAPEFLLTVSTLVASLAKRDRPTDIYLVRVRNWFDHKWLGFSGIGRVPFLDGPPSHPGVALDEFFQDQLTFPPFSPKRIEEETYYRRTEADAGKPVDDFILVHELLLQHSAHNLHKRITQFSSAGLFVWFSSNTAPNLRGSVMAYSVGETISAWYASFLGDPNWRLGRVKGTTEGEVQSLISSSRLSKAHDSLP